MNGIRWMTLQKQACDCFSWNRGQDERRKELTRFYEKNAPDQVGKVEGLLNKYKNGFPNLIIALHQKYRNAVRIITKAESKAEEEQEALEKKKKDEEEAEHKERQEKSDKQREKEIAKEREEEEREAQNQDEDLPVSDHETPAATSDDESMEIHEGDPTPPTEDFQEDEEQNDIDEPVGYTGGMDHMKTEEEKEEEGKHTE